MVSGVKASHAPHLSLIATSLPRASFSWLCSSFCAAALAATAAASCSLSTLLASCAELSWPARATQRALRRGALPRARAHSPGWEREVVVVRGV